MNKKKIILLLVCVTSYLVGIYGIFTHRGEIFEDIAMALWVVSLTYLFAPENKKIRDKKRDHKVWLTLLVSILVAGCSCLLSWKLGGDYYTNMFVTLGVLFLGGCVGLYFRFFEKRAEGNNQSTTN